MSIYFIRFKMKLSYLYGAYFLFGFIACVLLFFDIRFIAVVFRWLGLLIISVVYFKKSEFNNLLFYFGIIFSGIAETFIVIDFLAFFKGICVSFIIYAWAVIFLVKKSVHTIIYKINKEHIVPLVVSSVLVIYLIFAVLDIVTPRIQGNLTYGYLYIASLIILLFYLGIMYVSKHNKRYIWLLFLLISYISSNIIGSIDALYYHHDLLEQSGAIIQIASHFFLLKFLITPEENINYIK